MTTCGDCHDFESEFRRLDALPVVDAIKIDIVHGDCRAICTMWCKGEHSKKAEKQPQVICNKSTCTTPEAAMRKLRANIVDDHASCVEAAQAARLAAGGPASRPPPNALLELMAGQKATRVAAQAEMALKAVESELVATIAEATRKLSALRAAAVDADRLLPTAKRRRKHSPQRPWHDATAGWDEQKWLDFEDGEQTRRAVEVCDGPSDIPAPNGGALGFLHHWRRGLLGAVRSWARGSKKHVINMIMALIGAEHGFGCWMGANQQM